MVGVSINNRLRLEHLRNSRQVVLLHKSYFAGRETLQADFEVLSQLVFQLCEVGATEDLRVHIAVAVQPQEHFRALFESALLLRAVEPLLYVLSKSFVQHSAKCLF